jgi:hypothetical protein
MGRLNMKDNMENFKKVSDEILKDIYITDELEKKILEKCINKRFLKLNALFVSTAFAAILIVTFGMYNYFSHKPTLANNYINNSIKHEYKNSVDSKEVKNSPQIAENKKMDNSKDSTLNNENNIKNDNYALQNKSSNSNTVIENKNTNKVVKSTNTIPQNLDNTTKPLKSSGDVSKDQTNDDKDKNIDKSIPSGPNLSCSPTSLNIKDAEKHFGSKILLPSYIPEGFDIASISIPDNKVKCIKLSYSSDSSYFEILQSKSLSNLEGNKIIAIENNKAYVSSIKDEKSNTVNTKISWIVNNIEYSLYGNLKEDSLINVAKSIK